MTEEELNEKLRTPPYLNVEPYYYFMNARRLQQQIEREFGYKPHPEPEPPKKEPRWFVVHDGYDTYVAEHHTKKEALADMKDSLSHCWLIKGKIVK